MRYKTGFASYTIALWQQSLSQASANLGPILYQTTNSPDTEFGWLVQTYDMDLESSNVFFVWLSEGGSSAQGNQSATGKFSSPYFNTTSGSTPGSSTATATAPTSTIASPTSSTSATTTFTETRTTGRTTSSGFKPTESSGDS
ncbi:hypothetical protein TOPH_06973, partial [Tolypocladium ophioglossoides CBS 100239]